jgi:DNA-binding MarR family transcriptional regulator
MDNLSYLIIKASRLLKNSLDKKLNEYNITAVQFSVLNQIAYQNGTITSAEVASSLSSDRPTISGIINRLEEKKLIEKIYNPEDKRSVYLHLSKETLLLVEKLREVSDDLNNELLYDLSISELETVQKGLNSLINRLEDK